MYIYLPLSGLVPFFPTFCKYLYLNQNILANYKNNNNNKTHDVIVRAAPRQGIGGMNTETQGITELADSESKRALYVKPLHQVQTIRFLATCPVQTELDSMWTSHSPPPPLDTSIPSATLPSSLTAKGRDSFQSVGIILKFIGQRLPQGQRHRCGEAAVLPEWCVQCPDVTDTL